MGEVTMQTENESEEQGEVLTALELVDVDQDDGEAPGLIPRYRVYREAEQSNGIGSAVAAINRAYSEADQQGQSLAALNAIKLGALLASPALDSVREAMKVSMAGVTEQMLATVRAGISSFAVDAAEHVRQQMTASLSELPRLMFGDDAIENFRHASMGGNAIEIMRGAGINDSIKGMDTWRDAAESLRLTSGYIDGVNAVSTWRESLASINSAQQVSEQALRSMRDVARGYAIGQDAINSRMTEQLNVVRAEQRQRQETYSQLLTEVSRSVAAEQQQRREAMRVAFADVERWQGPSILWREAVPHHWQVYEPEPKPVQAPVQVTLENIELELRQGRLPLAALEELLQRYKCGMPEPISPDIRFVALAYKEHGHRYDSQETFVTGYLQRKKDFPISVQTFKRWISQYESATGERIRPGRGSRKRRTM